MRIVAIGPELAPYSPGDGLGRAAASLCSGLAALGHEVHAIAPMHPLADPAAHSLARRLNAVDVETRTGIASWIRYDGQIPSGVRTHVLEDKTDQDRDDLPSHPSFWDAFAKASLAVTGTLLDGGEGCCISFVDRTGIVPLLDREAGAPSTLHLLVLHPPAERLPEDLESCIGAADRALVVGRVFAERHLGAASSLLEAMLADARAAIVPLAIDERRPIGPVDKASAKARLQAGRSLPRRRDVPLLLTGEPAESPLLDALPSLLARDIQVIVRSRPGDRGLEALAERYPDRLALVDAGDPEEPLMVAADGCLVLEDPRTVVLAMSRGAVPVTAPECAEGIVDLDPSLESGSGIVAEGDDPSAIEEAVGRFAGAFETRPAFGKLAARLPSFAGTWPKLARHCADLIARPVS